MPDKAKPTNPVLKALMNERDLALHNKKYAENQESLAADSLRRVREQFKRDEEFRICKLQEAEREVREAIAAVEQWDAAIRSLRLLRIAGEADAIAAIGPEEQEAADASANKS